jgi:hypothetical protein
MIESIGSYTSTPQRVQSTSPSSRLQDPHVLTAIQQTQQRSSGATAPVRVFRRAADIEKRFVHGAESSAWEFGGCAGVAFIPSPPRSGGREIR